MTKAIEAAARKVALENDDYDGPVLNWEGYVEDAEVAITAYLAAMRAEGWVMVPVEASDKMRIAAERMIGERVYAPTVFDIYRAMIAASTQHDDGGE